LAILKALFDTAGCTFVKLFATRGVEFVRTVTAGSMRDPSIDVFALVSPGVHLDQFVVNVAVGGLTDSVDSAIPDNCPER
jgi:hypothetical protein